MPDRVEITGEIRDALKDGLRQRGLDPDEFAARLAGTGDAVSATLLKRWLSGAIRTARAGRLEGVLAALDAIPPRPERTARGQIEAAEPDRNGRIRITAEIREKLVAEYERTGIGPKPLIEGGKDVPKDLTPQAIGRWLHRRTVTAPKSHLSCVLRLWSERGSVTRLTPEIRARLRSEAERTGHSWPSFLRALPDAPRGLTAAMIKGWVHSYPKAAPSGLLDWVLERFAAMPDKPPKPPRPPKRKPGRPRKRERPGADPGEAERERPARPDDGD